MYSKISSAALQGIDAELVCVETDVAFGFPAFSIVGLPDASIRESRERVRTAILNSGWQFPDKRVTVNLSPADIRKEGSHFDLPIAISILTAAGALNRQRSEEIAFLGELALDGRLNRIKGALPLILGLRDLGFKTVIVPEANRREAGLARNVTVLCASGLEDVLRYLEHGRPLQAAEWIEPTQDLHAGIPDFADVSGQESAKRVLQIAAAAMHNVILAGPPGSGKTMLARRLPGIMPPMTWEESLEVTKIYSSFGLADQQHPLITERPFRAPDHTISPTAMIGGGRKVRPGEVSLAHLGVLFLDELPEFQRASLEALRKPMEDERCTVSRLSGSVEMPSKMLVIGAMNLCPCGYLGAEEMTQIDGYRSHQCTCTPGEIDRYRRRISGPFLDRFDLMLTVSPIPAQEIHREGGLSSADLRVKVLEARARQDHRYKKEAIRYNSQMRAEHIQRFCRLDRETKMFLDLAYSKNGMSIRGYDRVLRVARTIADMDGRDDICLEDAAEAISFRMQNDIVRR